MQKLFSMILTPFIFILIGVALARWSVIFPIIFLGFGVYFIWSFFTLAKGGSERSQFYFSYFFGPKLLGYGFIFLVLAWIGFYSYFTVL